MMTTETGVLVMCKKSPPGYERFLGEKGFLSASDLPDMIFLFAVRKEGFVTVAIRDASVWGFDLVIVADQAATPNADCSDYIRSFIGKMVKVMRAPNGHQFGMIARVIGAHPMTPDSIACLAIDSDIKCVITAATSGGWEFAAASSEPPVVGPVATTYDENRFGADLCDVIESIETEIIARVKHVPLTFKKGEPIESAMSKVIGALILRENVNLVGAVPSVLHQARLMLLAKNRQYGDSALNPVRIFASSSPMEQLLVRLDDKVSRLERGQAAGEDVANDLLGYLLLVLIAEKRAKENGEKT